MVDVIVYPIAKGRKDKKERDAARSCTSDVRQKMNDRTAVRKFRRLLLTNFRPNDLVVTLTYSPEALPATPEKARDKYLKPFIRKLRAEQGDAGLPYVYTTEGYHGDHRLHHHMVLPDRPAIQETIRELWAANGDNVGFDRIASRGYDVWSSYLTKEPRKTGRRRLGDRMWTPSIGLKKPEVIEFEAADTFVFEPPSGVKIELNETVQTDWFQAQYVSYYIPDYLENRAKTEQGVFN